MHNVPIVSHKVEVKVVSEHIHQFSHILHSSLDSPPKIVLDEQTHLDDQNDLGRGLYQQDISALFLTEPASVGF